MDAMLDFERHARGGVLFAEDFDITPAMGGPPEPEVIEPGVTAAELAAAEAQAWQAGHDAALADAAVADHAMIRETIDSLAAQWTAAWRELHQAAEQSAEATARLLLGCLGTMLPALCARYGEAELHGVMQVVLSGLFREPSVTVRVNPRHAGGIADEIQHLHPEFAARLQIVPTDAIPPGDARLSWRGGGATRDTAALWAQLTAALSLSGLEPSTLPTEEIEHAG